MIIDIFKTSIYKTSINNKSHVDYFFNLLNNSLSTNKTRIISNQGGFQTNSFFNIENKELIHDIFINPVINYLNSFKIKKPFKLGNYEFWINKNIPKSYNNIHSHGNNSISGIYYLKVPEKSGNLIFQYGDSSRFNNNNGIIFDDPNFYQFYVVEPKDYDLILFFSEILHYVELNNSEEDRISVAFNIQITS